MMKLQFNWTGCVTQLLWYDEVFPFFPYEHLQLPEGCGALQWAQGSVCILTSSVSLRARLETPALLSSHLGSRFEPEATDAAVRVEWNRQRAWLPRGPDACDHPLYPAASVTTEYTGQSVWRTVRWADCLWGEIAEEAPWSAIFSILTWTGHPKYEADSDARPESIMFLAVHKLTGLVRFSGIF